MKERTEEEEEQDEERGRRKGSKRNQTSRSYSPERKSNRFDKFGTVRWTRFLCDSYAARPVSGSLDSPGPFTSHSVHTPRLFHSLPIFFFFFQLNTRNAEYTRMHTCARYFLEGNLFFTMNEKRSIDLTFCISKEDRHWKAVMNFALVSHEKSFLLPVYTLISDCTCNVSFNLYLIRDLNSRTYAFAKLFDYGSNNKALFYSIPFYSILFPRAAPTFSAACIKLCIDFAKYKLCRSLAKTSAIKSPF